MAPTKTRRKGVWSSDRFPVFSLAPRVVPLALPVLSPIRARHAPVARATWRQPGSLIADPRARTLLALPDGGGSLQTVGKALDKLKEQSDHLKVFATQLVHVLHVFD